MLFRSEAVQARARNERLPGPAASGTPFSALRGRLALPVRGELASRFGSPRNDGGLVWRGLFLTAPGGTPVNATRSSLLTPSTTSGGLVSRPSETAVIVKSPTFRVLTAAPEQALVCRG